MAPMLLPKSPLAANLFTPSNPPDPPNHTTSSNATGPSKDTNADTLPADAVTAPPSHGAPALDENPKKRKRKPKETPHVLQQSTFRKPTWSYFHLRLTTLGPASLAPPLPSSSAAAAPAPRPPSSAAADIDALTVSTLLAHPLKAYLGATGAATPIDILKTRGRDVYIRVPRQDARGLRASLSGWIGSCAAEHVPRHDGGAEKVRVTWRVVGESGVLAGLGGDGADLFGG